MKLYILFESHSPYMYSDYPTNTDNWAVLLWIGTNVEGLVKYVNRCRIRSENEFRKDKPHRLDDNDDSIDFEWTSPHISVLVTQTDCEVNIDCRDGFEEWSEGKDKDYQVYDLDKFLKNTESESKIKLWHPDPEVVKMINESIKDKDADIQAKLKEYKKLKQDLFNRGYLGHVD